MKSHLQIAKELPEPYLLRKGMRGTIPTKFYPRNIQGTVFEMSIKWHAEFKTITESKPVSANALACRLGRPDLWTVEEALGALHGESPRDYRLRKAGAQPKRFINSGDVYHKFASMSLT